MRTRFFFRLTSVIALLILGGTLAIPAAAEDGTNDLSAAGGVNFDYDYEGNTITVYSEGKLRGSVHVSKNYIWVGDARCDGIGPVGRFPTANGGVEKFKDLNGCKGSYTQYGRDKNDTSMRLSWGGRFSNWMYVGP